MSDRRAHPYPAGGAWRVHPVPGELPRLADPGSGEHPKNRFDDPDLEFRVRYAATTLEGCFVELLQDLRHNDEVEAMIAAVGLDAGRPNDLTDLVGKPLEPAGQVPPDFLEQRRAARLRVNNHSPFFDIADPDHWPMLETHPTVSRALERLTAAARSIDPMARYRLLTAATISLDGPLGRPITQALSRVVWEQAEGRPGVRYTSQFDPREEYWAIYDRTSVTIDGDERLAADNPEHRRALQGAASLHQLQLPAGWE